MLQEPEIGAHPLDQMARMWAFFRVTLSTPDVFCRIKKELMGLVASLCQDVDYEVRACMCQQLETIARALG